MHHEIEKLEQLAKQEIDRLSGNQQKLSANETNEIIEQAFSLLSNSSIRTVGPELIFGVYFGQTEPPVLTVDLPGKFNHFFLVFSFLVILLLILFCVHLLPICPLLHRPRALGGSHINSYHLDTGS